MARIDADLGDLAGWRAGPHAGGDGGDRTEGAGAGGEIADTVTFAMAPDEPRATVVQRVREFHSTRDVELSIHVPVVGNTVSPFMAPPDTDTDALRAADSLAYLPRDPRRPLTSCAGDARRSASPTSPSARMLRTRSLRSSPSWPAGRTVCQSIARRHERTLACLAIHLCGPASSGQSAYRRKWCVASSSCTDCRFLGAV